MTEPSDQTGAQNRVFVHPEGYIEVETVGQQSVESVRAMGDEILALAKPLQASHQPVYILDNLTRIGLKQSMAVPKAVAAEARRIRFDRAAMVGPNNRLFRYGTNFLIQAIGKGDKIRYFIDRAKAVRWLLGR